MSESEVNKNGDGSGGDANYDDDDDDTDYVCVVDPTEDILWKYYVFYLLKSTEPMNEVVEGEDDVHIAGPRQVWHQRTKVSKAGHFLHRL